MNQNIMYEPPFFWLHFVLGIHLRPYQLHGVQWLAEGLKNLEGCILGDEMGLGKTCQVRHGVVFVKFLNYHQGCVKQEYS